MGRGQASSSAEGGQCSILHLRSGGRDSGGRDSGGRDSGGRAACSDHVLLPVAWPPVEGGHRM